jgi:hypothetical protein
MSGRLPLLASASAWVLFSMRLADILRVWESPATVRWHAIVPFTGLVLVCAIFWPRRPVR